MSSQPPHAAVLIPGPIEFDDAVLQSMGHYSESHVGPAFVAAFGETLTMTRQLFQSTDPSAQPFIVSGSGTLGWDMIGANLIEKGDSALVLNTGYFSNGFADCLKVYGADVTFVNAPVGSRPQLPEIQAALKGKNYKIITVTHVDTSTGVLSELKNLSRMVQETSPETLIIVDGVCSVACEEIAFDEWGLDAVVTASQKAIGCPAGLSISYFSGKAIETVKSRKTPVASYFANLLNWMPIMQNYENKKPSYFATPSPQLVRALNTALKQALSTPLSERFAKHKEVSDKVKEAVSDLGLKQVAGNVEDQAHGMTAIYLPDSVKATELLPILSKAGVVFAGGIHKEIQPKYIRFGHMGVSVMDPNRPEIDNAIAALKAGLTQLGYLV
ncbi:hypothetical protein MKZ38_001960 [Zalerion maritima]|uniref:alanine--glyoxylate transaminase n=1 Tax=Zalerion maritima TaxID=339359 RepID=A0AAD5RPP1_9PEZI|nr:hypothetical protein MKZ38_001960 [Zalerion maritima]